MSKIPVDNPNQKLLNINFINYLGNTIVKDVEAFSDIFSWTFV